MSAPFHDTGKLLSRVHNGLHCAMTDPAILAPAFAVCIFGDVGLDDGEEGEVVALAAVEAGA